MSNSEPLSIPVYVDGKPGTIVDTYYDDQNECGYYVEMGDGKKRWISHTGAKGRLTDRKLPNETLEMPAISLV